jgi:hypothetical protein
LLLHFIAFLKYSEGSQIVRQRQNRPRARKQRNEITSEKRRKQEEAAR